MKEMKWRWVAISAILAFVGTWYTLKDVAVSFFIAAVVGICVQMAYIFALEEYFKKGSEMP